MLKAKYTVYLRIYINISCICKNNIATRYDIWSVLFSINTEGKSYIMNPAQIVWLIFHVQ